MPTPTYSTVFSRASPAFPQAHSPLGGVPSLSYTGLVPPAGLERMSAAASGRVAVIWSAHREEELARSVGTAGLEPSCAFRPQGS